MEGGSIIPRIVEAFTQQYLYFLMKVDGAKPIMPVETEQIGSIGCDPPLYIKGGAVMYKGGASQPATGYCSRRNHIKEPVSVSPSR